MVTPPVLLERATAVITGDLESAFLLGSTDRVEEWLVVAPQAYYFVAHDHSSNDVTLLGHLNRAGFFVDNLEISPFFGGYIFTHHDESVAIASNFVDTPEVIRFLRTTQGEAPEPEGYATLRQEIDALKRLLKQADFSRIKREIDTLRTTLQRLEDRLGALD